MRVSSLLVFALAGCSFSGGKGGVDPNPTTDGATAEVDAPGGTTADAALDASPPDAPPDAPAARSCGTDYVAVPAAGTQSTYKRAAGASFAVAQADCADDGDGAYLVIPNTQAEGDAMFDFVDGNSAYIRAGISRQNDVWTYVTGGAADPTFWAPSEPDMDGDTTVLVDNQGRWFNWNATAGHEYACECEP